METLHFDDTCALILAKDIKRQFSTVVDLGASSGHFSKLLELDKVKKSIMIDSSGTCDTISNFKY